MDQIKERENKVKAPEIEDKELRKITEAYKQMTPGNQYFIVAASSMLLASQETERERGRRE